jgi:ABC-2 type transport system ATP-binding protein
VTTVPIIQTIGLAKSYGQIRALTPMDLEVRPGEIFGFLGPNGAGKTTTIRLLTGFIRPTAGVARVFGLDAWRDTVKVKWDLGLLPDISGLDEGAIGEDLLDYLASLQGRPPVFRQEMLDRLELPRSALRRRIKTYSHGMRRKLALVQAFQHDPALLILDEPTAGLDPLMQQAFFKILEDLRARGKTVFMSSHNISEVERLCDRVGIVRGGELVAVERVETLRQRRVRQMEVVFAGAAPLDGVSLPGVVSTAQDGRTWRLVVRGDINPLLRELARHDIEDLVFEQAHLEDVFLDYYRGEGAQR